MSASVIAALLLNEYAIEATVKVSSTPDLSYSKWHVYWEADAGNGTSYSGHAHIEPGTPPSLGPICAENIGLARRKRRASLWTREGPA